MQHTDAAVAATTDATTAFMRDVLTRPGFFGRCELATTNQPDFDLVQT
jgi:hypothetical protein